MFICTLHVYYRTITCFLINYKSTFVLAFHCYKLLLEFSPLSSWKVFPSPPSPVVVFATSLCETVEKS